MSDGAALWRAIKESMRNCSAAIETVPQTGREKAELESAYRQALAQRELELRASGKYPLGMIRDLARGSKTVSDAYVARQAKEALFTATLEQINYTKRETDTLREQMAREWGRQ